MFTQYKIYIAVAAALALIASSFSSGWTTRGWKDDKAYAALLQKNTDSLNKALEESKKQYESKVQENAQIGQKYEVRINDLLTQLKSHRVQYITKYKSTPSAGNSEPTSGSSAHAAQQDSAVLTAEELDQLIKDAVDDGVRLESLQDYIKGVCIKKD